jgi:hypothetical protein
MKVVLATLAQFHAAGYSWRKSLQVGACLTSAIGIFTILPGGLNFYKGSL